MPEVRHLALVRDTPRVDASDLTIVGAALQSQVLEDFAPAWHRPATVDAFLKLEDVPLTHWPMIVRDDISYDAQGIHLDDKWGPYALIKWDAGWSLTASHECLEMLADPKGNRLRSAQSPKSGQGQVRILVEVCDPSEAGQFAYEKNGVVVSDFYFSTYFNDKAAAGQKYSFTGAITKPRQVLEGGYLSWRASDGNWWQQTWLGGAQPKFISLGAKPARVSPRRFTDGRTAVPHRFLKASRSRTSSLEAAAATDGGSPKDKARAMRANIRDLVGDG